MSTPLVSYPQFWILFLDFRASTTSFFTSGLSLCLSSKESRISLEPDFRARPSQCAQTTIEPSGVPGGAAFRGAEHVGHKGPGTRRRPFMPSG